MFIDQFEIIYQDLFLLIHGDLEQSEDNHEIIKYCYLILADIMRTFCVY